MPSTLSILPLIPRPLGPARQTRKLYPHQWRHGRSTAMGFLVKLRQRRPIAGRSLPCTPADPLCH